MTIGYGWEGRIAWSFLLFFVAGAPLICAQEITYELPFSGQPLRQILKQSTEISCESRRVTSTGYYPRGNGHLLLSGSETRSTPAIWKVSFVGDPEAYVVGGTSATPERFQVMRCDSTSVILVGVGQGIAGGTVQVLTVHPQNGSFIAANSSVGPLWNRTGVWVGQYT